MSSFIPFAVLAGSGLYVGKQITDYVHERDDAVLRIKCMPQNESVSVVKFVGARVLVGFESLWWGVRGAAQQSTLRQFKFRNSDAKIRGYVKPQLETVARTYANTSSDLMHAANTYDVVISKAPLTLPVTVSEEIHRGPIYYDAQTEMVGESISDLAHAIASEKVPFDYVFSVALAGLAALVTIVAMRRT
jgi:hypothetical protein